MVWWFGNGFVERETGYEVTRICLAGKMERECGTMVEDDDGEGEGEDDRDRWLDTVM